MPRTAPSLPLYRLSDAAELPLLGGKYLRRL